MTHVTIIGAGAMGQAIASLVTKAGHDVRTAGEQDVAPVTGDIVVLAVPHSAVPDVLQAHGAELDGRIVVDLTNPVDMQTFDSLTVPADSSAAAQIAQQIPGARVLKAFNTTFAATLTAGTVGPLPTTVLIAGDDSDAKATLAGIVSAGGLRAIDAGSLARAREMEALGFLQISLAANEKISWTGGFGVVA